MGSDLLNVFSLDDSGLTIRQRFATNAGSGPRHIAQGLVRFAIGALDGRLERAAVVANVRDPLSITLL
jgi:hypothetical protein